MKTEDVLSSLRGPAALFCPCGARLDVPFSLQIPAVWFSADVTRGSQRYHSIDQHDAVFTAPPENFLAFEDYEDP